MRDLYNTSHYPQTTYATDPEVVYLTQVDDDEFARYQAGLDAYRQREEVKLRRIAIGWTILFALAIWVISFFAIWWVFFR